MGGCHVVWVDIEAGCGGGGGCRGGGGGALVSAMSGSASCGLITSVWGWGGGTRGRWASLKLRSAQPPPLQRDPHLASPGSPQRGGNHGPGSALRTQPAPPALRAINTGDWL